MKISELIKKLEIYKEEYGDVEVYKQEYDENEDLILDHTFTISGGIYKKEKFVIIK